MNSDGVKMKISIIVPVFNKEKYVEKVLLDVLNQSLQDFECILIDDGSTDLSGKICDNFATEDKRFCVIHIPNGGVSHARNVGLVRATGEYVTFIDADDHIEPDYLMCLYTDIESSQADMVIAGLDKFWEDGRRCVIIKAPYTGLCSMEQLMPEFAQVQKQTGIYGYSCGKLIRRELATTIRFSEWLHLAEDFEFYLRIYPKVRTIYFEDKCKYHYLQEADNSSTIVCDSKIDYLSQLKLNLLYRNYLIDSGFFSAENQLIVQQTLTNYAYFSVLHSDRTSVPLMVQKVHDIVIKEDIQTSGKGVLQRHILYYIRENKGRKAQRFLKMYDCLRQVKWRFLHMLRSETN